VSAAASATFSSVVVSIVRPALAAIGEAATAAARFGGTIGGSSTAAAGAAAAPSSSAAAAVGGGAPVPTRARARPTANCSWTSLVGARAKSAWSSSLRKMARASPWPTCLGLGLGLGLVG